MFKVTNSLIRYWESEFSQLKPNKNNRGDRKFTVKDLQVLNVIYILVKEKGYTIEGAKKAFRNEQKKVREKEELILKLEGIKQGLSKIKAELES